MPHREDMERKDVGLEGRRGRCERIQEALRGVPSGGRCWRQPEQHCPGVDPRGRAERGQGWGGGAGGSVMRQVPRAGEWVVLCHRVTPFVSSELCDLGQMNDALGASRCPESILRPREHASPLGKSKPPGALCEQGSSISAGKTRVPRRGQAQLSDTPGWGRRLRGTRSWGRQDVTPFQRSGWHCLRLTAALEG